MKLVSKAEFARLAGVSDSTVSKWLQAGRIRATADGRIDADAAQRMRLATESPLPRHQARKAQFEEARAAARGAGLSLSPDADDADAEQILLGAELKRATVDLQRAKAELALIEIDRAAGALVDKADVDFVLADLGALWRATLDAMPDRYAGEVASKGGDLNAVHAALAGAAHQMQLDLCSALEQRMESLAP